MRFRIDGVMSTVAQLPRFVHPRVVTRIKVMAEMDIAESRAPQDGRCRIRVGRSVLDLRVASIPSYFGEKIAIRLLDPAQAHLSLEGLGMEEDTLEAVCGLVAHRQGIVLVTGPTGSGKTSTLYSILNHLRSETTHIISIEDPIEFELPGVNQTQVHVRAGLTFAAALRSVLRQDPDVIMVGEIRDEETADLAFNAALTGHLVLSTLHTNDAPSAVDRLRELGISSHLVASALRGVIAQRLVRRVCPGCRTAAELSPEVAPLLGVDPRQRMPVFEAGAGCKECRHVGYHGRLGIFEVLSLSEPLRRLVAEGASGVALLAAAREEGLRSLADDALLKIRQGQTTASEVLRVLSPTMEVVRCPACRRKVARQARCPVCHQALGGIAGPPPDRPAERPVDCAACGTALEVAWVACPGCGAETRQPAEERPACPACGEALRPTWRHCPHCGAPREGEAVTSGESTLRVAVWSSWPEPAESLARAGFEVSDGENLEGVEAVVVDFLEGGAERCRRLKDDPQTRSLPLLALVSGLEGEEEEAFLAGADRLVAWDGLEELEGELRAMLPLPASFQPPPSAFPGAGEEAKLPAPEEPLLSHPHPTGG